MGKKSVKINGYAYPVRAEICQNCEHFAGVCRYPGAGCMFPQAHLQGAGVGNSAENALLRQSLNACGMAADLALNGQLDKDEALRAIVKAAYAVE